MRTRGRSKAMTIGLTVMLLSVSAAMHLGAGGSGSLLLLCFGGVLVGASLVAAGVRMADGATSTPIVPVVLGGARALAVFVRRNTAAVGLVMASCAFTVVSGEEDPALCFGMFALLLLGLTLVSIGARGQRYREASESTMIDDQSVAAGAAAAAAATATAPVIEPNS